MDIGKIIALTIVSVVIIFLLALAWETCLAGTLTNITKPARMKQKTWDFLTRKLNKTGPDEIGINRPNIGCIIVAFLITACVGVVVKVAPLYNDPPKPSFVWAGILTFLMIALSITITAKFCHPTKGGESLREVVLTIALLFIFRGATIAISNAWTQAFPGHNFFVSVFRSIGPWMLFLILSAIVILRALFVMYKYKGWYHGWRLFVTIVATLIVLALLVATIIIGCVAIASATKKANEADAKAAAEAAATTTTETTTTEPEKTSVAKDDKKSEPKAEEPKTEEPKAEEPTSGPNFGITAMGVGFNYIEYNDRHEVNGKKFTAKERWNAFGLNREDVVDKKEQREEVKLVAKEMPEVLAAYSVAFFTDEEKKELGIKGKTAKEVDHMFDQPGGGELQEKLYKKLVEIIDSDETQLMDVVVKGWQWSDYLFHKDKDKDGYCTPEEVELCTAKVYRNNQPQLLVQRLINKKWVSFGYLNKKCRYQLSGPDEPKDVPKDPDEPTTPPPPHKEHKDPADSTPTTYNQPNVNPTSHSADTNTGEGSTVSSQEPGSQTGSAPGSANFNKPEDYIEYNQNELKEQLEQQEKNEAAAQNPSEGGKVVTTTEDPPKEEKGDGKDNKSNKDDKSKTNTTTDFYSETPEEIKQDKENVGGNGNKCVDFSNL